jgi:hypothetical protein
MTLGSNTDEARTTAAPISSNVAPCSRYQDQAWRWPPKTASLDSVCARRPVRLRSGRKKACGAVEQKKWSGPQFCLHPGQRLENGSTLARTFFALAVRSEQPCVRPIDAARTAAGHNALRGSGPGQILAFEMRWHWWVVPISGSTGSALRAVGPSNLHITPMIGAISFMPPTRQVPCSARLWPSLPTPCAQSCWRVQWQPPLSVAWPTTE